MRQRFSIAMCTYNGSRFLGEQLQSTPAQHHLPDESVVCDGWSTDGTPRLPTDITPEAPLPVRAEINKGRLGPAKNFEKAIGVCRGGIIVSAGRPKWAECVKRSRRRIEEFLWATGLHTAARALYKATVGRQSAELRESMRCFYGSLLPAGALVFDIGANVGVMSQIFASLGARVVALEPNMDCVRHIQPSYQDAEIEVIQAVAGPKDGLATLSVSDERDDLSSLSKDWIVAIQRQHGEYSGLWAREMTVPMLKLDTLVQNYGVPYLIKIDVEGFEEQVLQGLSVQPPLLSFEFNMAYLEAAFRCLDRELFAGKSQFNFAMGDPVRFELATWITTEQLKEALATIGKVDGYGDVFVRRPTP
jgi:FkbM family methyltransferase